ncbi:MAG: acyltransferase [Anaerolineae bacterium]|nr:acyltransferase [Anaerolineae bacterium]
MPPKRIDSLQVYRAIAAIMVVLFHMTDLSLREFDTPFLGNIFTFGYVGVDFFFVLSGFIILYIHKKDVGRKGQTKRYLTKRFIRLYPIYWGVASVKIMVVWLMPTFAKSYETDVGYIIKSLLLIPQKHLPIIGAAWTLSYEVWFYLLFGLAILIGARWALRLGIIWVIAIMGVLIGKAAGISIFGTTILTGFLLNERNLEFILGCLAAYWVMKGQVKYSKRIAMVGGVLFLFWSWWVNQGLEIFSFTFTFGIASFLLVVGSASLETRRHLPWPKPLVFLGDASYSIYLTHDMFLNIFTLTFLQLGLLSRVHPLLMSLTMVILAIAGGSFIYLFLEKPLIHNLRMRLLGSPKSIKPLIDIQKVST